MQNHLPECLYSKWRYIITNVAGRHGYCPPANTG